MGVQPEYYIYLSLGSSDLFVVSVGLEYLFQVLFYLTLEDTGSSTTDLFHSFPEAKGNAILHPRMVMRREVKVSIHVGWFSVHGCTQTSFVLLH